jgi:hypothetical protein
MQLFAYLKYCGKWIFLLEEPFREFGQAPGIQSRRARRIHYRNYEHECLARIIHEASTAAADPGMSTALRSFGLLDVLSSTPPGPSVARLVSTPICAASLRTFMNNAG